MKPILEMHGVCCAYDGKPVLKNISFSINQGDTVILQGPNGCGKTTLLRVISALMYPEQGTYCFGGETITPARMKNQLFAKAFHQKIGYVFQNSDAQLFCSTVRDEIAFGPQQMGLSADAVQRRTMETMALLGIEEFAERVPWTLSGGEKKKVAIACVLSMNPEILVLDEPLAGLDRAAQCWLRSFLQQLKAAGKTILIATHDDELAGLLGERFFIMNETHEMKECSWDESRTLMAELL